MGSQYAQGLADMGMESGIDSIQFEMALNAHMTANFYPPLPQVIVTDTIQAIKDFNAGEILLEELPEKCHLKTLDAVIQYHGCFLSLDEEDF